MNKDALVATLIGFGVGLIITGIFLVGPDLAKFIPKINLPAIRFSAPQTKSTPAPSPLPTTLTIDAPLSDAIETGESVLVSGSAPVNTTVVIEGPQNEVVISTNGSGKYAGTVNLSEGKNEIVVTGYSSGKVFHQSVNVFYTPESF